jgi:hypothetical protein
MGRGLTSTGGIERSKTQMPRKICIILSEFGFGGQELVGPLEAFDGLESR